VSRLRILSRPQIEHIRAQTDADLTQFRGPSIFPLPDESTLLWTLIDAERAPELIVDPERHTADDAENAVKLLKWLPNLDKTQAADPRLWTTLGLREFWSYMQNRWPVASEATVVSRYLVSGGRKALNRQGVARLWWGAALTYAPWERHETLGIFKSNDPARFTRVFFSQQQYAVDLMERNLGGSLLLRTCVLAGLEEFGPKVQQRDDLSQAVGKNLNQLLQTHQLETKPPAEVRDEIRRVVEDVANSLRPAAVRS
jgi:hypothetical protein